MKVGDIVKIKENLEVYKGYGGEFFTNSMEKYRGKQAKIIRVINSYSYDLDIDNGENAWSDDMLEPVFSKKYEVIVEGNTVTVTDDKGNTGIAKCSPEDEFNLSTGITLAIERLKWKPCHNEYYWAIDFSQPDYVVNHKWVNDCTDNGFFKNGVIFKTEKEAIEVAKKMLEVI